MAAGKENKTALVLTRVFDAPRGEVWRAWTDPGLYKRWWGPKNFTAPVVELDLRKGGRFLGCMRGPDGKDYWSTGEYREIVPGERLVCTDSFADEKGNIVPASHYGMTGDWPLELLITVTFEDAGSGRTKMTLLHEGIPEGMMREMTATGWSESFDKLAESVVPDDHARIVAERGKQEVVITRLFDAPRDLLFRAYTDPNLIPEWWGPKRFTTVIDKMEVKQGGVWRVVQRDASGEYAFHGVYHKVRAPELVVSTFEFEGTPGHVSLETATFEERDGKTLLTTRSVFQSVEDRDGMLREGMEEGMYESLDRLAGLLAKYKIEKKAA